MVAVVIVKEAAQGGEETVIAAAAVRVNVRSEFNSPTVVKVAKLQFEVVDCPLTAGEAVSVKPVGNVQVVSPMIGSLSQKSSTIPCNEPAVAKLNETL